MILYLGSTLRPPLRTRHLAACSFCGASTATAPSQLSAAGWATTGKASNARRACAACLTLWLACSCTRCLRTDG